MAIDLNNGLVAYYKFSNDYTDETGTYNGTNNGTTFTTDKNGVANQAITCVKASGQYVDLGTAWGAPTSSAFSISAWAKAPTGSTQNAIFGKGSTSTGDVLLYHRNDETAFFFSRDDAGTFATVSGGAWPNDEWIHIVVVRHNDSLLEIYTNGEFVQNNTNTVTTFTNPHNWNIGAANDGSTRYFEGEIDEIRYYNRALTKEEILALYRGYDAPIPPSAMAMGGGV